VHSVAVGVCRVLAVYPLLGAGCSVYICNTVICCDISKNSNLLGHDTMSGERFMKVQGIIVPLSPGPSHLGLLDPVTLNMNQTLGSADPSTQPNISEDLNPQVLYCENLESWKCVVPIVCVKLGKLYVVKHNCVT